MADTQPEESVITEVSEDRLKYAFYISIIGITVCLVIVIVLVAAGFKQATDIVAVTGLFTSIIGTIVGAFLGVKIGEAGKEDIKKEFAKERHGLQTAVVKEQKERVKREDDIRRRDEAVGRILSEMEPKSVDAENVRSYFSPGTERH